MLVASFGAQSLLLFSTISSKTRPSKWESFKVVLVRVCEFIIIVQRDINFQLGSYANSLGALSLRIRLYVEKITLLANSARDETLEILSLNTLEYPKCFCG